jgi:putative ABC transport system permease protein
MSRRIGAARLAWRSATTTPAVSVLVIVVVALVSFAGTVAPRLLQVAQTTMVQYALSAEAASQRDFGDSVRGMPSAGAGGSDAAAELPDELRGSWGKNADQLAAIGRLMEPRLGDVVGQPRTTVHFDVATAVAARDDVPRTRVILTLDPRLDGRIDIVEGAAPAAVVAGEPIDILLTDRVAEQTGWTVGEVRTLDYPLLGDVPVRLSGIARAIDPSDPAWSHVPASLRADVHDDGLSPPEYTGVAFADARSLAALTPMAVSASTDMWFPLDVDRIRASGVPELVTEMRRFGAAALTLPVISDGGARTEADLAFVSVAASTLTKADERAAGVAAVIAVAVSGPVAVAIVVLVLAARLLAVRRRTTVALAAARGASQKRIVALLALEGAVLGVAGGVLGLLAGVLVGHGTGPLAGLAPLLVALIPAVALPALGLRLAGRRGRADEAQRRSGPWRGVAELTLVAVAAAAVVLTLATDAGGPTPLLVVLPVLLAAAGCVVALRITPVLLRIVGRSVRSTRGLVPLLGPARAERDPAIGVAPVLAIVVGTAIAVFSSGFLATVASGTDAAARALIGADIRVTSPYFTQEQLDAIARVDGVAAAAPVYADVRTLVHFPRTDANVTVFVIDADELRAVQGEGGDAFPAGALEHPTDPSGPVPVVISDGVAELVDGEAFELRDSAVEVVATVDGPSPFGSSGAWIAVDRAHAGEVVFPTFSPTMVLVRTEEAASLATVRASIADLLVPGSATTVPAEVAAQHHTDPGSGALAAGLFSAIGVVAVLLALAIALTLVLSSAARGRLFALLGALGLPRRQELGLVAWELAPAIVVSVPVGALVGLALVPLVSSALDLTVFTGGFAPPATDFGGATTAGLVLLFLLVSLAAVAAAYLFARRTAAARTIRTIDEEG